MQNECSKMHQSNREWTEILITVCDATAVISICAPIWQHQRQRRQTKTGAKMKGIKHTHTHTKRGREGRKAELNAYATCSAAATPFRRPPPPRLHSLPACLASCWAFSLLNSCRCYWDKKIYWLRMFFVTDFDLCAFYMFGASIFYLNSFCLATSQQQRQRIPSYSTKWICFKCCNSNERARRWLGWLLMINNWKVVKALRIKAAQRADLPDQQTPCKGKQNGTPLFYI